MINARFTQSEISFQPFSLKITLAGMTLTMSLLAGLTGCQKPAEQVASAQNKQTSLETNTVSTTAADSQIPTVYATTNVWGSVAKAVGGDKVNVVVGVNDLSQDPHDYQATATDKLNINKSALVLVNGGGYDDWGISLAESVTNQPVVINAVALSGLQPQGDMHVAHDAEHEHGQDHEPEPEHQAGHHHAHGEFNEHVFFSLDTAKKVTEAVNNQLAAKSPANKAIYAQNTQQFIQQIDGLKAKARQVTQQAKGQQQLNAFATEPVIGYLLADMGINDITPKAYVEQSETDAGVSVKVLNDSKNLLANKQVGVLIINAQTEDATSKQLVTLAKASTVPVVEVYETFPAGITSYTQFIEKTLDDFAAAMR